MQANMPAGVWQLTAAFDERNQSVIDRKLIKFNGVT